MVENRRVHLHVVLSGIVTLCRVCSDVLCDPGEKLGQNFATKHVSVSEDPDGVRLFIVAVTGVDVSPALLFKVVEFDSKLRVMVEDFGVSFPVISDGSFGLEGLVTGELLV